MQLIFIFYTIKISGRWTSLLPGSMHKAFCFSYQFLLDHADKPPGNFASAKKAMV